MKLERLAVLLVAMTLAACATDAPPPVGAADAVKPSLTTSAYRIGIDDRLDVSVWRNPDLSVTVPVRPDGKISVPLAGDVRAAGLTPTQVAADVRKKLEYYIRDPNVTVIVTEMPSHDYEMRVRVTGAVNHPESLAYRPGMTVLDAVLAAGGINEYAAPNRTVLDRVDGNRIQSFHIPLGSMLDSGRDLADNMELQAGDVIAVPERLF